MREKTMSNEQTKAGTIDPSELTSAAAKAGDPPYFHRQPSTVTFDFDQGLPDAATYPADLLVRLATETVMEPYALEYSTRFEYMDLSYGNRGLREELAAYLDRRDGGRQDPDGIMIVHGSAHGLSLLARAYLEAGDAVFVEAATFPFGIRYFESTGATVIPVALDTDGMQTDDLRKCVLQAIDQGLRPKLVYVIATHQLPTGAVLSLARRRRLLEMADEFDFMIQEDNVYREHGPGSEVPTLLSLDKAGRVFQTDSFAKTVAPAIRIGWVAGTPEAIMPLSKVRQDLGASMWLQRIMAKYLAEGHHEKHISEIRAIYAEKRKAATQALRDYCSPEITFDEPVGGWYYWLKLSEDVDWIEVQAECMRRGIAMRPGDMFSNDPDQKPHMRLAVGHVEPDVIVEGIRTLGEAIRHVGSRSPTLSPSV
jgi:2-aminoadipate transaminase